MSRKFLRIGAALAGLIGVFLGGMSASRADDPAPPTRPPHSAQSATSDAAAELLFRPITPCRAFDSRPSQGGTGAIAANANRDIQITGTGLNTQGGQAAGCGIPATASAVVVNATAVAGNAPGFIVLYPKGVAKPLASSLNFGANSVVGNNATAKIGGAGKITAYLGSTAPADLVVDVTGYYVQQIDAFVNYDGTFYDHSQRVLKVTHPSTGWYSIGFDRNVASCSAVATPFQNRVDLAVLPQGDNSILVTVEGSTLGNPIETSFSLTVTC